MDQKFVIVVLFFLIAACLVNTGCTNTSGTQNQLTTQQTTASPTLMSTPSVNEQMTITTVKTTPQPTSKYSGVAVSDAKMSNQIVLEETYIAQYNNWYCADLQEALGQPYIDPDEKYKIVVSSSTPPVWGHTNILIVDNTDYLKFRTISPRWDDINKKYVYAGIVPVVQFNDVMSERSKSFSVENMGKYFLCLDDRQDKTSGYELKSGAPAFEVYVKLIKNPE
jgi:hypothetical protein